MAKIKEAETDAEIVSCYPVIRELRPHITESSFLHRVKELEKSGYKLIYLEVADRPVAVAGFRFGENLAWGRYLYVDDLVTFPGYRSKGYGSELLSWLKKVAEARGCEQLHLDSGIQRKDAHRFYEREGMELSSYHFREILPSKMALRFQAEEK